MNAFELDRFVGAQLRALPQPGAPETLLPRVLAAARAWTERPWYAREWFAWPFLWQAASAAMLALIIGSGVVLTPALHLFLVRTIVSPAAAVTASAAPIAGTLEVFLNVARVIWRGLVGPLLPYAFAIVLLMFGACLAFGLALNRLVVGRVLHP